MSITMNGKNYTATTIKGISQRVGTAGEKRDADITELVSVCAMQAASGNLNWFNDYLLTTKGVLHVVTGKPTIEGKAILAYLKLVYPAVEFVDQEKAFDFVEGVNREKYFTGEVREKKGKKIKVKAPFDTDFAGFPLTFGAFKNEWHEEKKNDDPKPFKAKALIGRLSKLSETVEERGIDHHNIDDADIIAMEKALSDEYARVMAEITAAKRRSESTNLEAVEQLSSVTGGHEKRADTDRAAHAATA